MSVEVPPVRSVLLALWHALLPVFSVLGSVLLLLGIARLIVAPNPRLYEAERTFDLVILSAALVFLLREGFLRLSRLKGGLEAEVYLTVLAIGIASVSLSSVVSYGLYRIGAVQYELDDGIVQQLQARARTVVLEGDSLLDVVDTVAARFQRGSGPITLTPVRLEHWWDVFSSRRWFEGNLPNLGAWSLQVDLAYAGGVPGPSTLRLVSGSSTIYVDAISFEVGVALSRNRRTIARELLTSMLSSRARNVEATQVVRSAGNVHAPPGLFLYQGIMTFLGSNPRYLTPIDFGARTVALIGALFRFVYAALVLSLFVKYWTRPRA